MQTKHLCVFIHIWVFAMPLWASVCMRLVVTCWERADILALVCGVLLSLSVSHWFPGSGVVLECIDSWSLHPYLLKWAMLGAVTIITDAVSVNCNEYGWDIAVDIDMLRGKYPDMKTSNIYLGKNLCHGFEDGSRLKFKQGLRDRLTSETVSA